MKTMFIETSVQYSINGFYQALLVIMLYSIYNCIASTVCLVLMYTSLLLRERGEAYFNNSYYSY